MAKTRTKSKSRSRNPKAGKVLYDGRYLVGREHPRGMIITATPDGREEAQDLVASGRSHPGLFDMFEDWIGNGWTWIPPEAIGALTDGEIISRDAWIDDDGNIAFDKENPRIYWFSDYQVVDPVKEWAEGEPVFFDLAKTENNPKARTFSDDDLPEQFHTPPIDQGQIVEYSYGATPEGVFMRVNDRSDRTETYWFVPWSKAKREDKRGDTDYWNRRPLVTDKQWEKIIVSERRSNPGRSVRALADRLARGATR